jgi:hypothetical protein
MLRKRGSQYVASRWAARPASAGSTLAIALWVVVFRKSGQLWSAQVVVRESSAAHPVTTKRSFLVRIQ